MGGPISHRVTYLILASALTQYPAGHGALLQGRTLAQTNQPPRLSLQPCEIPGIAGGARCGVHHVLENRQVCANRWEIFERAGLSGKMRASPSILAIVEEGVRSLHHFSRKTD